MADVTPPGEGPPPMGHEVPSYDAMAFISGATYQIDLPDGGCVMAKATGHCSCVVISGDQPAGTILSFDKHGKLQIHQPPAVNANRAFKPFPPPGYSEQANAASFKEFCSAVSALSAFLDKSGPKALTAEQRTVRKRLEDLRRIKLLEAAEASEKAQVKPQPPEPEPIFRPVRSGRAIELD